MKLLIQYGYTQVTSGSVFVLGGTAFVAVAVVGTLVYAVAQSKPVQRMVDRITYDSQTIPKYNNSRNMDVVEYTAPATNINNPIGYDYGFDLGTSVFTAVVAACATTATSAVINSWDVFKGSWDIYEASGEPLIDITWINENLNKTVEDILKTKKGSIKNAPKKPGDPNWDSILKLTLAEILKEAQKGDKGFARIYKLLTDGRFNR